MPLPDAIIFDVLSGGGRTTGEREQPGTVVVYGLPLFSPCSLTLREQQKTAESLDTYRKNINILSLFSCSPSPTPPTPHNTHARPFRGLFGGLGGCFKGERRTGEHPPKRPQKPPKKNTTNMPEKARPTQRQPTATRTPGKAFAGIHGALPLPATGGRMACRLRGLAGHPPLVGTTPFRFSGEVFTVTGR